MPGQIDQDVDPVLPDDFGGSLVGFAYEGPPLMGRVAQSLCHGVGAGNVGVAINFDLSWIVIRE